VQMIDTSIVRVHQHAACIADSSSQSVGRSRGGLTSKLHVVVDAHGLSVRLGLTPGEAHDNRLCAALLIGLKPQTMVLADRGYHADWIRALVHVQGAWANIPPEPNQACFPTRAERSAIGARVYGSSPRGSRDGSSQFPGIIFCARPASI
jgi:transposase